MQALGCDKWENKYRIAADRALFRKKSREALAIVWLAINRTRETYLEKFPRLRRARCLESEQNSHGTVFVLDLAVQPVVVASVTGQVLYRGSSFSPSPGPWNLWSVRFCLI